MTHVILEHFGLIVRKSKTCWCVGDQQAQRNTSIQRTLRVCPVRSTHSDPAIGPRPWPWAQTVVPPRMGGRTKVPPRTLWFAERSCGVGLHKKSVEDTEPWIRLRPALTRPLADVALTRRTQGPLSIPRAMRPPFPGGFGIVVRHGAAPYVPGSFRAPRFAAGLRGSPVQPTSAPSGTVRRTSSGRA